MQDLTLDDGTRLLHVGPHKTGTTTVQGAFNLARERLAELGVYYPPGRQPVRAAQAITGGTAPLGEDKPQTKHWNTLVRRVNAAAAEKRIVVSSEFFADGDDDAARRVVEALSGDDPLHVVVTLRPLTKIVSSQWQQYVQSGLRMGYADWLHQMFEVPPYNSPTPSFWRRHTHDQLVERWAAAVGTENLTVVVADESDPMMLVRTFESLLGLPEQTLVPERARTNRSLTAGEVELVRMLNVQFRASGWPEDLYAKFLRYGAIMKMKAEHAPGPDEAKVVTPRWALERAAAVGGAAAAKIANSGVRIVGDLDSLGAVPPDRGEDATDQGNVVATASAAQAVLGAIGASDAFEEDVQEEVAAAQLPLLERPVRETDAKSLVQVLLSRARRRMRRGVRRSLRIKR
ncbi:MAG: hypothetical protein GEV07_06690 [Streptosporangiales bacterium]|nr:hypothetical protein [Streptosporangiales bacterium]